MRKIFLACILVLAAGLARADLRGDVEALTRPEMEGRKTGSEGAQRAAEYLIEQLEAMGAQPVPGGDGYRWPFEFSAGSEDVGSSISINGERSWDTRDGVQGMSFSNSGELDAEVVFAGYGLHLPESAEFGYDSYHGLDVEGKIVLVLRYFPEDTEPEVRSELARYAGLRYKAMHAREQGAKAILVVAGPNSPNAGETVDPGFDTAAAGSGILAASISGDVAAALLEMAGAKSLGELQTELDTANPHVTGFALDGVRVALDVKLRRDKKEGNSVLGLLPATHPAGEDEPALLVGAHFDHLGNGDAGTSLAKKDEAGQIHHGADDNASGTAAVLELGRRLAERPRPVVLAFWSGEEIGLVGSETFCSHEDFAASDYLAYLNFDMVGRLRENKLTLQSVGSSDVWAGLIERANVPVGLDLNAQDDPYVPTDANALYKAGVPTLNFFTGAHEDYHRPTDTADRLNYEGLELIVDFAENVSDKLLSAEEQPSYTKISPKKQESGGRDSVRAYTGTIPDYTSEAEGLLLSGVIEGGPADEAGLRGGDVIVEFNGQTIANIYDYTYALDGVKIGEETAVVVLREGERVELTLVPGSR